VRLSSLQNRIADPSREQGALDDDEHGPRTTLEIGDRAQSVAAPPGHPAVAGRTRQSAADAGSRTTIEKIPANTYPGLERDVTSAGVMAILVVRSNVADERVYSLTKAVFDNLPQFQSSHPAARHLSLHTALTGMALPLHPGAERYFQQNGIAR
jgi:hypothetical protein